MERLNSEVSAANAANSDVTRECGGPRPASRSGRRGRERRRRRQPLGGHFVEAVERVEGATVEQVDLDVMEDRRTQPLQDSPAAGTPSSCADPTDAPPPPASSRHRGPTPVRSRRLQFPLPAGPGSGPGSPPWPSAHPFGHACMCVETIQPTPARPARPGFNSATPACAWRRDRYTTLSRVLQFGHACMRVETMADRTAIVVRPRGFNSATPACAWRRPAIVDAS